MPTLDVDAQIRALGSDRPLPNGRVILKYLQAPGQPAVTLAGADLTFSPTITVQIVDGELDEPLVAQPTDEHCYAELTVESFAGGGRFETGPVSIPVDAATIADLVPVDPATFEPLPAAPPSAQELIERAETAIETAEASLAGSGASATAAATSATSAASSAASALGSEGAAGESAARASGAASEAESSRAGAVAASASAVQARDAAGAAATSAHQDALASESARQSANSSAEDAAGSASSALGSAGDAHAASEISLAQAAAASQSASSAGVFPAAADSSRGSAAAAAQASVQAKLDAEQYKTQAEAAANLALTGQMLGSLVNVATDFNTFMTAGIRRFTTAAAGGANSPKAAPGVLRVSELVNSVVIQEYVLTSGLGTFSRSYASSGGWTAWRFMPSIVVTNPADQPGFSIVIQDGAAGVDRPLATGPVFLGTTDLNALTLPGSYFQSTSGNGTLERNYPVAGFYGTVEVTGSGGTVNHRATPHANAGIPGVWERSRLSTNAGWGPWRFLSSVVFDQTAGRTVAVYDYINSRMQVIYGDTGWRDIAGALINSWTANSIWIRRTGPDVTLKIGRLLGTNATSVLMSEVVLQNGFKRAGSGILRLIVPDGDTSSFKTLQVRAAGLCATAFGAGVAIGTTDGTVEVSWKTSDTWPTSLPGDAVGSIPT